MTNVEEREVYPHAPVVLVALEVRHPAAGHLSNAQRTAIKSRLSKRAPIMRTGQVQQLTGAVGAGSTDLRIEEFPRYFSRDNTWAIAFRSEATVVETTRYVRWEKLYETAALALNTRHAIAPVDGIERVGLRYVDEIRVPTDEDGAVDWSPWIDPTLLGPAPLAPELGLEIEQWEGVAIFRPEPDHTLVLRYGPRIGYAVEPRGDLKRPAPPPGLFFLMDIDSFWTPSEGVPEFDVDELLQTCDKLHAPVRRLFERLITERLREEVLRDAK